MFSSRFFLLLTAFSAIHLSGSAIADDAAIGGARDISYDATYRSSLPEKESLTRGGDAVYRIVGGKAAKPGAWPSMVALIYRNRAICGGTVIDKYWVLTAAHCVANRDVVDFEIEEGTVELNAGGRRITVADIRVNPNYRSAPPTNDTALLKLKSAATSPRQPLLLSQANLESPKEGDFATIVGFGRIHPRRPQSQINQQKGGASDRLLQADVPIVGADKCRDRYGNERITASNVCAGFEEGRTDACQGDSGGPLLFRGKFAEPVQIGVVSWGAGCAQPKSYGVYASVAASQDWIRDLVPAARFVETSNKPPGGIGAALSSIPAYLSQALSTIVGNTHTTKPSDLAQLSIDLVNGPKIRLGDLVQLRVTSSVDGNLAVYNRDPDGKTYQIFPNKFIRSNDPSAPTIRAGVPLDVPAKQDDFRLRAALPLGKNEIIALVLPTKTPVRDLMELNNDLAEISDPKALFDSLAEREIRTRGIKIEQVPLNRATARLTYELIQ